MKVYCSKHDCTFRKTFIGDTGEYSRNICRNANCKLTTEESEMETEEAIVLYCVDEQYNRYKYEPSQPEATISGWVCRDKDGTLCLYYTKPMRAKEEWLGNYNRHLPEDSFPSLTWQDDPIEVEITIKPKKK